MAPLATVLTVAKERFFCSDGRSVKMNTVDLFFFSFIIIINFFGNTIAV
jgi:hypothetical protein